MPHRRSAVLSAASTVWGLLAIVAVGVLVLVRVERRWLQLVIYALMIAALASFLQWGGPLAALGRIRGGFLPLELRAAGLLPIFVVIGGCSANHPRAPIAACSLATCGPGRSCGTSAPARSADRGRSFAASPSALFRGRLPLGLACLLPYRLAVAAAADRHRLCAARRLWDARRPLVRRCAGAKRALALAFFVFCFAAYWPATLWRSASYGLVGDEPSYLAATMSLWNKHNLELADSLFSPEMTAVLADPQGERELHVYEDGSADRMLVQSQLRHPSARSLLPPGCCPGDDECGRIRSTPISNRPVEISSFGMPPEPW